MWEVFHLALYRSEESSQNISDTLRTDSLAITTYEVGNLPEYLGQSCLEKHSIPMNHVAWQVTKEDSEKLNSILCMYKNNPTDVNRKSNQVKNCKAKIKLLGSCDPEKQLIIEDPCYGNESNCKPVYQQCLWCCKAFLEKTFYGSPDPTAGPHPSHPALPSPVLKPQAPPVSPCDLAFLLLKIMGGADLAEE